MNGTKNPLRAAVARDIRDAILKTPATRNSSAVYWSKEEQVTKLVAAFEKYQKRGGVWTSAAVEVSSH